MVTAEDFGRFETAWCPGCGNFPLLKAVKAALAEGDIPPDQVLFVSGIGQAAKAPHYMYCNLFNGLHGRSLPVATGAKLANPELNVIVESGDGCNYGEGGNHFLAAIRRNVNITMLVHDNQIYGLTKGQASPTTEGGHATKAQPRGSTSRRFNPLAVAVSMHAGFVARGFVGSSEHLKELIKQAMAYPGFALVDILQPCVSFNRVNTFEWYKKRCYELGPDYEPTDWPAAMNKSQEWGDRIPLGIIYRNDSLRPFEQNFPFLQQGPLYKSRPDLKQVQSVQERFL